MGCRVVLVSQSDGREQNRHALASDNARACGQETKGRHGRRWLIGEGNNGSREEATALPVVDRGDGGDPVAAALGRPS